MKSMVIAAGLAAALVAVPAAPGASASDGQPLPERLSKACGRVPQMIDRTQELQLRLGADAQTRGSLAWLQARQRTAAANGQTDRASMLGHRLTFRRELAGILPDRLAWLQQAQAICDRKPANPPATGGASS